MKKYLPLLSFILMFVSMTAPGAVMAGSDEDRLKSLLIRFLDGASQNDAAMHDRFWAEDLIYTSSSGDRFGKADIMSGMNEDSDTEESGPQIVYSAEEVQIQQYGHTAIVAFRLVGAPQNDTDDLMQFFNTGTFLKRDGEWRAVAWQATLIP